MYTIGKTFSFAAAHSLPSLPTSHKCHNLHGHNYLVSVELQSDTLDDDGFVRDYADLRKAWEIIEAMIDHHDLNEVFDFATTAENLAAHLYATFHGLLLEDNVSERQLRLSALRVQETPSTFAEWRP